MAATSDRQHKARGAFLAMLRTFLHDTRDMALDMPDLDRRSVSILDAIGERLRVKLGRDLGPDEWHGIGEALYDLGSGARDRAGDPPRNRQ